MSDFTEKQLKDAVEFVRTRRVAKNMTAAVPTVGIWYYVWLKPNWKLYVMGGELGHVELWPGIVHGLMKKHYDLDDHDIKLLENAPYGFPRGRCSFIGQKRGEGHWALQNGNDFPSKLSVESEKKKLIGEFNLTPLYLQDHDSVRFVDDEHEKMGEDDQKTVQRVIGKVPY